MSFTRFLYAGELQFHGVTLGRHRDGAWDVRVDLHQFLIAPALTLLVLSHDLSLVNSQRLAPALVVALSVLFHSLHYHSLWAGAHDMSLLATVPAILRAS